MNRKQQYSAFLKSDEWSRLRAMALHSTDGKCTFCGQPATDVHHVKYPKQFGDEHPENLLAVCRACHNKSHGVKAMKHLQVITSGKAVSPFGSSFNYIVGAGGIYASAESWVRALKVIESQRAWFVARLAQIAIVEAGLDGEPMSAGHEGREVYRYHVAVLAIESYQEQYRAEQQTGRRHPDQRQRDEFYERARRLKMWVITESEKNLRALVSERAESAGGITENVLRDALSQLAAAVAPTLRAHGEQLSAHHLVIKALPQMRDRAEYITTDQGIAELGYVASEYVPGAAARIPLSNAVGRWLSDNQKERGPQRVKRLDGSPIDVRVNTWRRGDVYDAIAEVLGARD